MQIQPILQPNLTELNITVNELIEYINVKNSIDFFTFLGKFLKFYYDDTKELFN